MRSSPEPILMVGDDALVIAKRFFSAFDDVAKVKNVAATFASTGWLRAGNVPRTTGPAALRRAIAKLQKLCPTKHTIKTAALVDETLFAEAVVTLSPHKRKPVSVPAIMCIKINPRGKIQSLFVGVDRSPSTPLNELPERLERI